MSVMTLPELLKTPLSVSDVAPEMKLWTLEEFARLYELGLLTERYELIEGVIVKKMGQNASHRALLHLIAQWIVEIFGFQFVILQSPVDFPRDKKRVSRLEPDITLLDQPQVEFSERNPLPEDVRLLVEVSDSSLQDDLTRKAQIYSKSGVPEYWVADVNARQIWVHRVPSANGYQERTILSETQEISLLAKPNAKILVSEFFPVFFSFR